VTTLHGFGGVLGWPLDTSFGLSRFHGHNSWLVCEVYCSTKLEHYSLNHIEPTCGNFRACIVGYIGAYGCVAQEINKVSRLHVARMGNQVTP
jgi:hypothetical protein